MIRRFARDESGMTMALAIIMIVLIGVMGAGLLTFVQNDLKSVVEANKGQRALDIADAGVEAAKAHLRNDSFREHYDKDPNNDCAEGWRVGDDNWSKDTNHWTSAANPGECETGPLPNIGDDPNTPWPEDYGVTKLFGGGRFHVTIECYSQVDDDAIGHDPCVDGATGPAPEPNRPATEKKFFKITSTGYDTEAGDGAVRKIEAIYFTSQNTYVPLAYWTPGNIDFNGTDCVRRMSFFAGGNITDVKKAGGPNAGCNGAGSSPPGIIADRAQPALYRDWVKAPYNTTQRVGTDGNPIISAGFGAVGLICAGSPGQSCDEANESYADGYHDYDSTTGTKGRQKPLWPTRPTRPRAARSPSPSRRATPLRIPLS
jgi:hypothetical protein